MSVRKRTWTTPQGVEKEAWVVDYKNQHGVRKHKTFQRKKEADAFAAKADMEVRDGVHVTDKETVTVKLAGELWIARKEARGRERATILQYRQHLDRHITPYIGNVLLSKLTGPAICDFEDRLSEHGCSASMRRKVMVSLGGILADAVRRGLVHRNVVRERSNDEDRQTSGRQRRKLRVGVDIPTPKEIKAIVEYVTGRWRPLLITAIMTGLRASELRGLRWEDVDFERREINVRQRADRYNDVGRPKSEAGERTIPMGPLVVTTLKEWKLACPKGDLGLAFPNGKGNVESNANIRKRGLIPTQIAAGVIDENGKAKYGMHALRHFYASWCINRRVDGGHELPPKVVQERLGHASITMTLDLYGHLFPRGDDAEELAAAERALLA